MKISKILTLALILTFTSSVKSQTLGEILKAILAGQQQSQLSLKDVGSTTFVVNSAANARLSGGKTRMAVKVNLPAGTTSWFYRVTVLGKESTYSYQPNESLFYLLSNNKQMDIYNPTTNGVDIYLLGHSGDVASFTETGNDNFKSFTKYTRTNSGSTVGSVTDILQENLWLGIKNPNATTGLKVIVEIVAQGKYN